MSWAIDTNYTPMTMNQCYDLLCENINYMFGTNYDINSLKATNWYRLAYPVIQLIRQNEIEFAEINNRLKDFVIEQNKKLLTPITSYKGIIDYFKLNGFNVAINWATSTSTTDAYGVALVVDVDPNQPTFDSIKAKILDLIRNSYSAGIPSYGFNTTPTGVVLDYFQTGGIVLSNGQNIVVSFMTTAKIPIHLRLTLTLSTGFIGVPDNDDVVTTKLISNLKSMWNIGRALEPEKYFEIVRDAPYAADILLEYKFMTADIPEDLQSYTTILPQDWTSAVDNGFVTLIGNLVSIQFLPENLDQIIWQ